MNINRYNYEEYFLLYVDDELSTTERRAVEVFVEQHPDLEEELSMLKQSTLKADATVVMEDKSHLFKPESASVITLENYETFFLLYVDEELNVGERRTVETFAANHPSLQQELNLLMQTKLQTDESIGFPNKNALYKAPAIGQRSTVKIYRMVAFAAMLLIAAGIFWLIRVGNRSNANNDYAGKENESKNSQVATKKMQEKKSEQQDAPAQQQVAQSENQKGKVDQTNELANANKRRSNQKNIQAPVKEQEETQIALRDPILAPPHDNVSYSSVASIDVRAINAKGTDEFARKTLIVDRPIDQTATETAKLTMEDGPGVEIGGDPVQTKSKFRGFFRQVKRVVEKTARVPGDETKKLLNGNIEVAVK